MKRNWSMILALTCLTAGSYAAQAQQTEPSANVMSGTVAAIGYPVGGFNKVKMVGTSAATQSSAEGWVNAKESGTNLDLKVK